ncbi:NAD(P)H-binding protein [Nocardiopsis alkaliphila]|uniref:NAD(P)H-binding protein n=1 Tax=Nocardiopsis alkaliphila TaxID=225762 RepID=UPI00034994D5|nr:NAD(P)H-binding protein [Nocardiopsis alkaliphila]
MTNHDEKPILVVGARGMTGGRVARLLREGGYEVRAASRSAEWTFDWRDRSTWDGVLEGAGSMYLVQYDPEPLAPAFIERAARMGVERVVLLSAYGADQPGYFEAMDFPPIHLLGEAAVRATEMEWTLLRPGWFAQNLSEGLLMEGVREGVLRLPTGQGRVSWIDTDDIAEVAVAALTGSGHHGRIYELSGAEALTLDETVRAISAVLGSPVRYEALSVEEYVADRLAAGWSRQDAHVMAAALSPIPRGLEGRSAPGVRDALGRAPTGFGTFARKAFTRPPWQQG